MPEYSLSSILPFARAGLRRVRPSFTFTEYVSATWTELKKSGAPVHRLRAYQENNPDNPEFAHNNDPEDLRHSAVEAWLYLQRRGFAITASSRAFPTLNDSQLEITKRGREWIEGREPIPELAVEYLSTLQKMVPHLDQVIQEYVVEGLDSFEHDRFRAAAVMIGAASEKAIYLLGDSLIAAFASPQKQKNLRGFLDGRGLKKLFDFLQDEIAAAIKGNVIPYSVHEGAIPHLGSLVEAIRVQRNDAVHPQNAAVTTDSVRQTYLAFPHALQKIEQLRDWFSKNQNVL